MTAPQTLPGADAPPDSGARHRRAHRGDWILLTWCALLTAAMLGPLAAPGHVLSYDMVAVPDQALLPSSVGLSSAMPRAVPLDAAVAILDSVLTGQVLQKLALAGIVLGAALGAGLALPTVRTGTRLVAASAYAWNAYVFERLVIGHWPTLIAYAALPWLLILGRRVRRGRTSALAPAVLLVGVSALTPTGGLLAGALFGLLVLVPGGRHPRRVRVVSTVAVLALQAPWIVPSVLRPDPAVSDPAGVAAFAAASDSPLGLLGSLLTLGGIWNEGAVPDSRALPSALALTVVLLALAVFGATELRRHLGRAELATLGALAAAGFAVAVSSALPGGDAVLEWLVAEVPGGGLIRDGQKFLAWYALLVALAAAAGAARVAGIVARRASVSVPARKVGGPPGRAGSGVAVAPNAAADAAQIAAGAGRPTPAVAVAPNAAADAARVAAGAGRPAPAAARRASVSVPARKVGGPPGRAGSGVAVAVALTAALLPVAALPDLVWGAAGRLEPSHYPAAWADVRAAVDAGHGDVVVLPYQPFRRFPWAGDRTVLDPAPRYLDAEVVVPDALPVGDTVVPGEDRRAAAVADALENDDAATRLAALGVGWVVVERDTPGTVPDGLLESLESVDINGTFDLYRVPGDIGTWTRIPPAPPVIVADIVFSVILAVASADVARNAFSRRRRSLRSQES
ncbi:hypothetical protein [Jiangella sp. DSM 45060]|uniref:hypothetical protein n=1 Tax=Jiangella sp. DSM 45060 TaxID=1798224 RepID=UPI00087BE8C7|nr:hypothetical protein [Jiangella sp. DSM 45060]SDS78322.1 hypothetical protein SAMN04515669_1913 [Jiangella sp. DSM 45060]